MTLDSLRLCKLSRCSSLCFRLEQSAGNFRGHHIYKVSCHQVSDQTRIGE